MKASPISRFKKVFIIGFVGLYIPSFAQRKRGLFVLRKNKFVKVAFCVWKRKISLYLCVVIKSKKMNHIDALRKLKQDLDSEPLKPSNFHFSFETEPAMKEKRITATHRQIIESAFPGHEIEVCFTVDAVIRHDDNGNETGITFVPVCEISVNGEKPDVVIMPSENTSDGRKFIGRMKEAVREEAYRQEKASAIQDAPREYRHTVEQMLPKFKPVQPGDDQYFYG